MREKHCYTPGHCFSTTYPYDTAPFEYPAPTEGLWVLEASFDDGSDLTGYFVVDTEGDEIRKWSLCAQGSPGSAFETAHYVANTSEVDLNEGQLQLILNGSSRHLFLSTSDGFATTEPEGLVVPLEDSWECQDCPDHERRIQGDIVLSDPYRTTWFPCDD